MWPIRNKNEPNWPRAISQSSNFLRLPRDGRPLLLDDTVAVVLADHVQSPAGRGIHGSCDELGLAAAAAAALAALHKLCLELGVLALQISFRNARHGEIKEIAENVSG